MISLGLHNTHYGAHSELAERQRVGEGDPADLISTSVSIGASSRHSVERVCENVGCGRLFLARVCDVRRGRGRHCSRACASATRARAQHARRPEVGPANRNFKGWASRHKRVYVDRFRAKYPEKARAHDAVKNALASGQLARPTICSRCGVAKPLHSHHQDYAKPLDVVFACRDCHRQLDAERRAVIAAAGEKARA